MNKKMALAAALMAGGFAAFGIDAALAGMDNGSEADEARAVLAAKVTVIQAAKAAESKAGGKASSVNFQMSENGAAPYYHVEVAVADGTQQDFAVDAASGEVSKILAAKGDQKGDDQSDNEEDGEGQTEGQN